MASLPAAPILGWYSPYPLKILKVLADSEMLGTPFLFSVYQNRMLTLKAHILKREVYISNNVFRIIYK